MPTLPIPFPVLVTGGDLPVRDADDVLAQYPPEIRETTGPVRDALAEGAAAIFISYQQASDYAAAQSDATRATGIYLAGITGEVGVHPDADEDDESLRDRYFAIPSVVTPNALKRLADAVLTAHDIDKHVVIFESVCDRLYLTDGTAAYHSFLGDGLVEVDPEYPDRRYDLRANSGPAGATLFDEHEGRYFVVRVPVIDLAEQAAFLFTTASDDGEAGLFLSDGTVTDGGCNGFIYNAVATAISIYQLILDVLYQARGAGVRITMIIDPKL